MISVRGSGLVPTTAANAALGCTGFMSPWVGARLALVLAAVFFAEALDVRLVVPPPIRQERLLTWVKTALLTAYDASSREHAPEAASPMGCIGA